MARRIWDISPSIAPDIRFPGRYSVLDALDLDAGTWLPGQRLRNHAVAAHRRAHGCTTALRPRGRIDRRGALDAYLGRVA